MKIMPVQRLFALLSLNYMLRQTVLPTLEELKTEIEGLKRAAEKLDALLQEKGITEDLLVQEFRQLREQER